MAYLRYLVCLLRLLIMLVLLFAIETIPIITLTVVRGFFDPNFDDKPEISQEKLEITQGLIFTLVVGLSIIIVIFLYRKISSRIERRKIQSELDRKNLYKQIAAGFLLGCINFSVVTALIYIMGGLKISLAWNLYFSDATILPILYAPIMEELLFRGFIFRVVEERHGSFWALIISSAAFGLGHILNANANPISLLCISLESGLVFGLAFALTRTIWFPMGLHIGWNFMEGNFFGGADSGNIVNGLFKTQPLGSALISGGKFGVEASLITVLVAVVPIAIMISLFANRGRLRHRIW